MDIVVIYEGENKCRLCEGWKRVNSEEELSWKYWAQLPPGSDLAVQLGLVRPVECPRCKGTGIEPTKKSPDVSPKEMDDCNDILYP